MKKITIVFIVLINYSCNSQNNQKLDITGNWYEDLQKSNTSDYSYTEIFIDDESFYMYSDVAGFAGHLDYIIEGRILYSVFSDTVKKTKGEIKFIDKNTILIGNNILFKRIDKGLKLEVFLNNNKLESEYLKSFNKRKAAWEKNRNKG